MNSNGLTPLILLATILSYFVLLYLVSYFTSRNANTQTFFSANKNSPWLLVAIGMIGASLSGATLISIPGVVGAGELNQGYAYMQIVLGYLVGYAVIALVLMPIYYKYKLTSIYGYLENRFGTVSYKMGAFFFLLSRIIGSSFRLYLMAIVLHPFVLEPMGVSFEMTVLISLVLIWVYTFKGGIKTIVWTDTIQTVTMLAAVVFTVVAISNVLGISITEIPETIRSAGYGQMFFFEDGWSDVNNFYKQFISGALIAIVMTGLDQDMMQKNLTCRSLKDAQKNILVFSIILVIANIIFLSLGAMLYIYAAKIGVSIPENTDHLYPLLALNHLPPFIGIVFVIGLIAAAYSSADSGLTSLTTSFCVDFLNFEKRELTEQTMKQTKLRVHIGFTLVLFFVIVAFKLLNNESVINALLKVAGYTYGPLLGMFTFGILTKRKVRDELVWLVVLSSPLISFALDVNSEFLFNGLKFGFFILAINGLITFLGLLFLSIGLPEDYGKRKSYNEEMLDLDDVL